ncbi:hypothetical protein [uncultured Aquimarina sp.]|uniref:hypothetical protein n=1 Tax=uncultured Aquimarina sp. TaxID=575652 RepID=UPI0026360DC1|nr:hypothetical protein [uncultured Aquimarina sp.]
MLGFKKDYAVIITIIVIIVSCTSQNKKIQITDEKDTVLTVNQNQLSPYEEYLNNFRFENGTDTLLVQRKSRIFYCGTGAMEYYDELKKNGLEKYFEKYKDLVEYPTFSKKIETNNKTKILWVNRGNEGELMQLENKTIRANKELEKRLFEEKAFVQITENPLTMDKVEIYTTIFYPVSNKTENLMHIIIKNKGEWNIKLLKREIR